MKRVLFSASLWIVTPLGVVQLCGCAASERRTPESTSNTQAPSSPASSTPARTEGRRPVSTGEDDAQARPESREQAPETFLGGTDRLRIAVLDFALEGTSDPSAGRVVADKLGTRLSSRWFQLIERSRLDAIVAEHDLQSSGVVDSRISREIGRLANVSHLVLGSVSQADGISVHGRLVDAATGAIVRQGDTGSQSFTEIDAALDALAAVLSASDSSYRKLQGQRLAAANTTLAESLRRYPEIKRERDDLLITVRIRAQGKRESAVYGEARQQLRETYAVYCMKKLGVNRSKSDLMSYCRENEECEDVVTTGAFKRFRYRIPLPN